MRKYIEYAKYQDYYELAGLWDKNGTTDKLAKLYEDIIKAEFHFDAIKEELDSMYENYKEGEMDYLLNEYEVTEYDESPCFGLYVGSCLSMSPSGKYYMPFARSNVTDKEGLKDEIYWETLETILSTYGMWYQSGEGDGLDVFFCKCYEKD